MDAESLRQYCMQKPGTTESFPFDEHTLVFKVGGKIYLLIGLDDGTFCNLKCDPEYAIELREQWEEVTPAYHMNKKHWNSVSLVGRLSHRMIQELIDHSYELVWRSLPKAVKASLQ